MTDLEKVWVWFWQQADRGPDCWVWNAALSGRYGSVPFWVTKIMGTKVASRIAYMLVRGPIPAGLLVRHDCDNPPCVRPEHLLVGTHADNSADMVRRKRTASARSWLHSKQMTMFENGDGI